MQIAESHQTKLTNEQKRVVSAIYDARIATQASLVRTLNKSQQAMSNHLKAIMANTSYITSEKGEHGETFYRANIDPTTLPNSILVTLPDNYEDPNPVCTEPTTPTTDNSNAETRSLQPLTTHLQPLLQPSLINNSNNNNNSIQPLQGIQSRGDSSGESPGSTLCSRKGGCKVVNSSLLTESAGVVKNDQKVVSSPDTGKRVVKRVVKSLDAEKSHSNSSRTIWDEAQQHLIKMVQPKESETTSA